METILGLCIGIGLSAACGFRIFAPLLVMSIACNLNWFEPIQGFGWLALPSVCLTLGIATLCEIIAYYIPWVDNILDIIATPAAVIAGTVSTMAVSSGEMSQFIAWATALIVGGGTAGAVQFGTVALRGLSTTTTGGVGNPVISTGEWVSAILISILSFLAPVMLVVVLIIVAIWFVHWFKQIKKNKADPGIA